MNVQRNCRLLLLIYAELGLPQDIQYIIIKMYFQRVVYRKMWLFSEKSIKIDKLISEDIVSADTSINDPGSIVRIDPLTNRLLPEGIISTDVLSIDTSGVYHYILTFSGDLYRYATDTDRLEEIAQDIRCFGCAFNSLCAITNTGTLFGTNSMRVTLDKHRDIYKVTPGIKCVYCLTNCGEVYTRGKPNFSFYVAKDGPNLSFRLSMKNIIDVAANSCMEVIITTGHTAHVYIEPGMSYMITYTGVPKLMGTRRVSLQEYFVLFHTDTETHVCKIIDRKFILYKTFSTPDVMWEGDKLPLEGDGKNLNQARFISYTF